MRARDRLLPLALLSLMACAASTAVRSGPAGSGEHRVAPGETLFAIANRYGVSVEALARANRLADKRRIYAGQRLVIPSGDGPSADGPSMDGPGEGSPRADAGPEAAPSPGDSALFGPKAPVTPPPEPAVKEVAPPSALEGEPVLAWPLDGVVISLFGQREGAHHPGIDIGAPLGTPVHAAADGEVLFAGDRTGYGKLLILKHAGELVTIYAHNAEHLVRAGDRVRRGQVIARVGQSGEATAPALHFEVRTGQQPINPLSRLPE